MSALIVNHKRPTRPLLRLGLVALGGVLGLLAVGSVLLLPSLMSPPAPAPLNGAVFTPPRSIPDLTLQRTDGTPFSTADLHGRLSLVFFGYTFCPDVCPMTLAEMIQVRRLLGPDAGQLHVYFVTVDPARDTPERLHRYVKAFDPSFEGLTGGPDALAQMRSAFGAIGVRRDAPDGGPNYFMDHTAATFLVNPDGEISVAYAYGTPPDLIAADVRQLSHQDAAGPTGRRAPR
jgi:protein SCO1/2